VRLRETRPGVFTIDMTAHELSVLLAGARMSLSFIDSDPAGATPEARLALESVLRDFDAALKRSRGEAGGEPAP
jgi:hypothetical protein